MRYRRPQVDNATFFFTVVTYKRRRILCDDENVPLIKDAFKCIMKKHPYSIDAFVMLPDHIHCIWTLPKGDSDFAIRWSLTKSYFTKRCNEKYKNRRNESRVKRAEQAVWQRLFWEHQIRDEWDFAAHVDYIHYNPVKHGYVKSPKAWPHSTFHRYFKNGLYGINWGMGQEILFDGSVGNE